MRAHNLPRPLTSLHHVVNGGEALEHGRADGAEDEQGRQAGVAHHGSSQQAAALVAALEAPRQDAHEPIGQRDAGVLAPPAIHHQGHVETWRRQAAVTPDFSSSSLLFFRSPLQPGNSRTHLLGTGGVPRKIFFYRAQMF